MTTDADRALYASKSDQELRALEKDGSLSAAAWQAVTEELRRRQQRGAGGASAPVAPRTASSSGDGTSEPRLAVALEQLRAILVPGETLEAWAVQRRLFALTHRRILVAATSGRLIIIRRGLIGGYTPLDVRWQDVEDAKLDVGIFGADLTTSWLDREDLASAKHTGATVTVSGLRKAQAERVYRVCQAQEQQWREKRRIRDLDEMRAQAGGVQIGMPGSTGSPASGGEGDALTRLQRAKDMLDNRLITDAEYESIKAKIVDRL